MSRKNVWRRRGALEFRRETCRLSSGDPWGDVLWVRRRLVPGKRGFALAYINDHKEGAGAELGLRAYHPIGSRRDAISCGKAARRAVLSGTAF